DFQVRHTAGENVENNPHAFRTALQLFIIALARKVGLQERLGHVAVPKMIAPAGRLSIFEDVKLPVPALVSQIQSVARPQSAHMRLSLRVGIFSLPIRAE